MFVKLARARGHTYAQIVESYRDANGQPRQRNLLTLGRVDDDLIIGASGLRRRVRLASVLRRCTVMDAQLRGNELTVRFRPDPEVWPA